MSGIDQEKQCGGRERKKELKYFEKQFLFVDAA